MKLQEYELLACPILVDGLEEKASSDYGARPHRLCIIRDNITRLIGQKGNTNYSVSLTYIEFKILCTNIFV